MRKLKLFLSLLMLMAFSLGNVWGAGPDVTYDFTGSDWSVSGSELTNGTVSFTGAAGGSKGSFKMNSGYLMLGKKGAYLNFPTYSSAVKQIVVTGRSGASGSTKMNIYVGNTAVSTETTGSTGENSYDIATASQTAGTTYTLNVTSDHNAQITKIEIYYAEAAPSCTKTVSVTKVTPTNGDFSISATEVCGDGDGGEVTISDIEPATGYALDEVSVTVGTYDKNTGKVIGITNDTEISVTFKELQKYTVSFNTGAGNPAVSPITEATAGAGITLPAGPTPACSADGWTFAGWSAEAVASETTSAPKLLSGNYKPTDNVTLFAVYKRTEGGSGAGAEIGATLFNEEFNGLSASDQPTAPSEGATVYGSASVSYTCESTYAKIYAESSAGGASPEMLIPRSDRNGYFEISNIPTGAASALTLTYRTNQSGLSVTSSTDGISIGNATGSNPYSRTITINQEKKPASFDLKFAMTTSSNGRLDNISIIVETSSAAGTTYYLSAPSCCEKHNVNIALGIQYGKVEADLTEACEGTEVTLTATPDEHCRFVKWDVKQGETPVAVSDNKFTMPAGDVTVSATFAVIKNAVTFAAPKGGTLSILNGEEAVTTGAEIVEGTTLTVTATPDAENHYIGGTIKVVKTSDESDVTASVLDGSTLTMPDYAITVSASFTPTYAINLVAEGGSIALDYTKGGAADGYAIAGTEIMATATADDAHVFASLALSENVTVKEIDENIAIFTMPAEAVTVTATFNVKSTPTIATDVAEVAFDATDYKGELAAKTFHVNGVALVAGKLTITSNNEAFSVSPAEIDVDGALDETEITITPRTTECGIFKGKITISGGNAEDKEVAVSLTVNKLASNLAWSAEEATVTINADNNVFPTLTNPRNLPVVYSSLYPEVASVNAETGAVELLKAGETMIIVNFAGNDTVTALAEDALSYTLTVQQKHTVEWYINGEKKGEQTAVAGVELENIPDATSIENGAIAGKVFRGWATATIEGEVDEAQAGIVATPTVMPGEDTRYYAVYAIEEGGEEDVTTIKYSGSSTTNMTGNNDAETLGLDADEWSVVGAKGSNSNFPGLNKAGDIRLYYNAGGSNTITITAPKSVDFVRMTFNTGYENVSVAVGGNPVAAVDGAYSINATTFVLGNANSSNVQVQIKTIDVVFATPISYTKYATSGPKKLANPTFGLEQDTYTEAQSVSITAGEGETIYYTLDGTEPTVENGRMYGNPIDLKSYGSYTIKAIAAKEDGSKSDVVTATYGINIPFETVTDLFTYIESGKAFLGNISVTGVVSEIVTEYSTEHSNITFNISDTGAESEAQFQSYRGVGEGIAEKVAVGDKVTITGEYTLYGTTHELKQGNVISNRVAAEVSSVVVSGEATKTEYFYNDDFSFAGLVATAIYNTGYTKVVTDEANVWSADPAKVTATGNVNVTATYGGKTSVDPKVVAVTKQLRTITDEQLAWTAGAATAYTVGKAYTLPTLTNELGLAVTYTSETPETATISNEEGHEGEISIVAAGSTVITASFAGNDEYAAKEVSYTLTVVAPASVVITGEASNTAYEYGYNFSFEGLDAKAVYTNEDEYEIPAAEITWAATPATVTMDNNVSVKATWEGIESAAELVAVTVKKHKVTIVQPDHGTLVVKYSKDGTPVTSGEELVLGTQLIFEIIPESSDYKAGKVLVNNVPIEEMEGVIGKIDYEFSAQIFKKAEAGLEWSSTYGEIQLQGTEIVNSDLPSLTNPYELTITYSSDDTDVAEIDPATGVITPKAEGYTTISATFAGNEDYKAAQVSFNLTVEVVAQPEFYVIGSFNGWSEYVPVYDTWYRLENLTSGKHQLKVTTAPNWADPSQVYGYDELTVKHAGLSKDNDGNICFTISNEINFVDIDFEKDEEGVKTFTVTGTYVKPTFTVVGVEALVGFNWGDGLNKYENEMVEDPETGNYELPKEDVMLAAGDYEYQVAMNHDWRNVSNSTLTITESGIYTVTFTFDPSTGATSAVADLIEPIEVLPTMKIAGDWDVDSENSGKWNENALIVAGDEKTASYTAKNLVKDQWYQFWIIKNGVYMSGNKGFDRENLSADLTTYYTGEGSFAMYFQADQDGDYTFTWTYETNVITMTFPYKEPTALDNTEAGETAVKVMKNGQLLIIKNGKTYNAQGAVVK